MTDRELILCSAAILGWQVDPDRGCEIYPYLSEQWAGNADTRERWDSGIFDVYTSDGVWREWNPLENITDAYQVALALPEECRKVMAETLNSRMPGGSLGLFDLIHASPRLRTEAACAAWLKRKAVERG